MKSFKTYVFIKLIIVLFYISVNGQQDPVIIALDDPDVLVRSNILYNIEQNNLVQYCDELEQRIFYQPEPFIIKIYLRTLDVLNSSQLESIIQEFIILADNFNTMHPAEDPLIAKVYATSILTKRNNFSTINYAYQLLDRDWPKIDGAVFNILVDLINRSPENEPEAKLRLIYIVDNSIHADPRFGAIISLEKKYGSELLNKYLNLFQYDSYGVLRMKCLEYLLKYSNNSIHSLLFERMQSDNFWALRYEIFAAILKHFGTPSDLKTIIDYQPTEPDETARSLMGFKISSFIPPRPTVTTAEMIENLISYNSELFQYAWITDFNTYNYFKRLLVKVQNAYSSQQHLDLCENINQIIQRSVDLRAGPLLTEEGYKFLFYHATYIKENIETEFGLCEEEKK